MILWRNQKNYPRIITKYSSWTILLCIGNVLTFTTYSPGKFRILQIDDIFLANSFLLEWTPFQKGCKTVLTLVSLKRIFILFKPTAENEVPVEPVCKCRQIRACVPTHRTTGYSRAYGPRRPQSTLQWSRQVWAFVVWIWHKGPLPTFVISTSLISGPCFNMEILQQVTKHCEKKEQFLLFSTIFSIYL